MAIAAEVLYFRGVLRFVNVSRNDGERVFLLKRLAKRMELWYNMQKSKNAYQGRNGLC
jgi:hypothetical protein